MIKISNGPGFTSKIFTALKNSARKNSPELLVAAGTVMFVGTLYSMYKTTIKVKEVVDTANSSVDQVNKMLENGAICRATDSNETMEYTEEIANEDIKQIKRSSAKKIVKAAAPTVILALGTLSCFIGADYIRKQRHAALFAASEMTLHAYNEYRKGVIEKYGPEIDRELKYKLYKEETEEEEINPETGRKKKVKREILRSNYDGYSQFARLFDECNDLYQKNIVNINGKEPSYGVYNLNLIANLEKEANKQLRERGYLTINDVYELLHFEQIKAGRDAGWIWDPNDPTCRNNTHINFGTFRGKDEEDMRAMYLGIERAFILDFNIDTLDVWDGFDDTPTFGLLPKRRK